MNPSFDDLLKFHHPESVGDPDALRPKEAPYPQTPKPQTQRRYHFVVDCETMLAPEVPDQLFSNLKRCYDSCFGIPVLRVRV